MTIYNNLKRFQEGRSAERAAGDGQQRILKADDRRRIAQLSVYHSVWSATKIRNEAMERATPEVTTRTIQGTLKNLG
jgi:hypothetical protein